MKIMIIFTDKTQNSMVRWCGEGGKGGWKPKILTLCYKCFIEPWPRWAWEPRANLQQSKQTEEAAR